MHGEEKCYLKPQGLPQRVGPFQPFDMFPSVNGDPEVR